MAFFDADGDLAWGARWLALALFVLGALLLGFGLPQLAVFGFAVGGVHLVTFDERGMYGVSPTALVIIGGFGVLGGLLVDGVGLLLRWLGRGLPLPAAVVRLALLIAAVAGIVLSARMLVPYWSV